MNFLEKFLAKKFFNKLTKKFKQKYPTIKDFLKDLWSKRDEIFAKVKKLFHK